MSGIGVLQIANLDSKKRCPNKTVNIRFTNVWKCEVLNRLNLPRYCKHKHCGGFGRLCKNRENRENTHQNDTIGESKIDVFAILGRMRIVRIRFLNILVT